MRSVLEVRNDLETVLVDYIGKYLLANGQIIPAISVQATGQSIAPHTKVSGIEVVLWRDPELVEVRSYRNTGAFTRWTAFITDWGTSDYLQEIGEILLAEYPSATVSTIQVPRGLGPVSQLRLEFTLDPVE